MQIPFGRAKGQELTEAATGDIKWVADAIAKKLEAEPNNQWAAKNQEDLAALRGEIARRQGGGQAAPQRQGQAMTRREPTAIVAGSFSDPKTIIEKLKEAESHYNLVAPSTTCGRLPVGFEVAISLVTVNPDSDDVYPVSGKNGLSKNVLDRIGGALGASWDPHQSGRLDDGSDPHYVHYRAVGTVRQFDGTARQIIGEKEMDLRPGSPQVQAIVERVEASNRKKNQNKSPEGQIREMRLHILGHAETKARLRAIRSLGLKTSYTRAELEKPFAVAGMMLTGRVDGDPELERDIAKMIVGSALQSTNAAYGSPAPRAPQLAPPTQAPQLHSPPPVGDVGADDSAVDTEGYGYEGDGYGQDEHQQAAGSY